MELPSKPCCLGDFSQVGLRAEAEAPDQLLPGISRAVPPPQQGCRVLGEVFLGSRLLFPKRGERS